MWAGDGAYHCAVPGRRTTPDPAAIAPLRRAFALAAMAICAAAVLALVLRLTLWGAPGAAGPDARLADWFDPAVIDANRPFRRTLWALAAAGAVLLPVAAVAAASLGARWRPRVVRLARGRAWCAGLITGAGFAIGATVVMAPVDIARFAAGRDAGVITQGTGPWLLDRLGALGVRMAIWGALGTVLAVLLARLPRTWWIALSACIAAFAVAMSMLAPVLIEPLFQRTEPVRDPVLRAQVIDLAERAGVDVGDVRVNDASARTTAANAYVSGLGASRRIVLYDTLVRGFPADQVRAVVAHELVHVERRHVLKGTVWVAVLGLPACLLLFAVVGWRTGVGAPGPGREGCDLVVRRMAVVVAAAAVIGAVSLPLQNAVSRSFEREADAAALALTGGDAAALIALQQGFIARNRGVPDPPGWVTWWFGTHPDALERIGAARAWEDGRR